MDKLEKKIQEIEQELRNNPKLDKEIKEILSGFLQFCKDLPKQIEKIY